MHTYLNLFKRRETFEKIISFGMEKIEKNWDSPIYKLILHILRTNSLSIVDYFS